MILSRRFCACIHFSRFVPRTLCLLLTSAAHFKYTRCIVSRAAARRMRASGSSPVCPAYVPAESTAISAPSPRSRTMCRMIPSAAGERQIFPRQTKSIFVSMGTKIVQGARSAKFIGSCRAAARPKNEGYAPPEARMCSPLPEAEERATPGKPGLIPCRAITRPGPAEKAQAGAAAVILPAGT